MASAEVELRDFNAGGGGRSSRSPATRSGARAAGRDGRGTGGLAQHCTLTKFLVLVVLSLSVSLFISIKTRPVQRKVLQLPPATPATGVGASSGKSDNKYAGYNASYWYLQAEQYRQQFEIEEEKHRTSRHDFKIKIRALEQDLQIEQQRRIKIDQRLEEERDKLGTKLFDFPILAAAAGVFLVGFIAKRFTDRERASLKESTQVQRLLSISRSPIGSPVCSLAPQDLARQSLLDTKASLKGRPVAHLQDIIQHMKSQALTGSNTLGSQALAAPHGVAAATSQRHEESFDELGEVSPRREFLDELYPKSFADVMDNFGAGIVTGTKFTSGMVAFSVLLYGSCPDLEVQMPLGIKSNLWSCVLSQTVYCLIGGLPYGMSLPQDIPCLLLGRMGAQLPSMVEKDKVIPTYMLLVSCQTLLCSFVFFLSYASGFSKIVMQLPSSLLSGFVFGNGLGMLRAAGHVFTQVEWKYLWPDPSEEGLDGCKGFACLTSSWWTMCHCGVGFVNFIIILKIAPWIKTRLMKRQTGCILKLFASFISPFAMLCCIPPFYILMKTSLYTMDEARANGWLRDPEPNPWDFRFWQFWISFYDLKKWEFHVIPRFIPSMISVAVISLVEAAMGGCSVESTCPRSKPLNLEHELRAHAAANLVVGLTGGTTCFLQTGMTINAHRTDGATHRMAGIVAAVICLTVFITGLPISTYVPRFMPGAVFLVVGTIMVKDAVVETFATMPLQEYLGIIIIGFVFIVHGMETAMIWGLFYAIVLFIAQSSAQSVLRDILTGDQMPSSRERSEQEALVLRKKRKGILTIVFQGCIFWGSVREIMDLLLPVLGGDSVTHIVFDLLLTQRVDGSACKAFLRIVRLGNFKNVKCCFVLPKHVLEVHKNLSNVNLLITSMHPDDWDPAEWPKDFDDGDRCPFFSSSEEALYFCEDSIIAECLHGDKLLSPMQESSAECFARSGDFDHLESTGSS